MEAQDSRFHLRKQRQSYTHGSQDRELGVGLAPLTMTPEPMTIDQVIFERGPCYVTQAGL
jgi:hypothetical protein